MSGGGGNDNCGGTNSEGKCDDLASDVRSILFDDEISDVTLIGSDGVAVPAVRAVLASRSKVFRRMFYGSFAECDSSEVRLEEFSGDVVRAVVQYCFTDVVAVSGGGGRVRTGAGGGGCDNDDDDQFGSHDDDDEEGGVRTLVRVSGAGHYFDIPRLERDVRDILSRTVSDRPPLACAVYDEAAAVGVPAEGLATMAAERMRNRPRSSLLPPPATTRSSGRGGNAGGGRDRGRVGAADGWADGGGGVLSLSASVLDDVVFDERSNASEFTKFLCLRRWAEGGTEAEGTANRSPPRKIRSDEDEEKEDVGAATTPLDRRKIARELAKKLDISTIPASDLSTSVAESGLVSSDDLFQAYRLQALNAERSKAKIIVEGAGSAEVNGTYVQGGVHEGTAMYNMEGAWREKEEVFRIFLCTYSNGTKSWCISIVPKGKDPGKSTDLDFYECNAAFDATGAVPSRGWKPAENGQSPSPKCTVIAGCVEES